MDRGGARRAPDRTNRAGGLPSAAHGARGRRPLLLALLLATQLTTAAAWPARAAAACQIAPAFRSLAAALPRIVGRCAAPARPNPRNGDLLQATIGGNGKGGLLVERTSDGLAAYTDGARTWDAGPNGIQERRNDRRFAFERDGLTLDQLRNASYRVAISRNWVVENIPLVAGAGSVPTATRPVQLGPVRLLADRVAWGDRNGDGVPDNVVILTINLLGSGTFVYAVAVLDEGGVPVSAGSDYLGDRVKVIDIRISGGKAAVDMLIQGPGEGLCCLNERVTRPLDLPWR